VRSIECCQFFTSTALDKSAFVVIRFYLHITYKIKINTDIFITTEIITTVKPNVLILTIDSLRADRLYGASKTSLTPNIDQLIKNGTYFSQAISTADTTGLCLGSLFTASYPFKTGITHYTYDPNTLTYFQILQNNGYNTFATFPDTSFFLKVTSNLTKKDAYVYDKRESWLQLVGGIGQKIVEKLEQELDEPWLYYIHLMDLHAPFYLPKEFDSEKYGATKYDRMISAIDFWIGKFLKRIDLTKTLVVVSSDHGDYIPIKDDWNDAPKANTLLKKGKEIFPTLEPIGLRLFVAFNSLKKKYKVNKIKKDLTERQLVALEGRGSQHLYDELVRIPLIFAGYGVPSSKIINDQVKQVDIFPTILEILNISQNKNVDGRSLAPLLHDESIEETPAYIETGARNFKNSKKPIIYGKIVGIRTSKYKYWRSRNNNKNIHLFDLQNDPKEEKNIANENPQLIHTMEQILNNLKKDAIQMTQNKFSKEEEKAIEEELKKLGYM